MATRTEELRRRTGLERVLSWLDETDGEDSTDAALRVVEDEYRF